MECIKQITRMSHKRTSRVGQAPMSLFCVCEHSRGMYEGPLGPHIDEFIARLQGQDYARHSIRCKVRVIADFSRWLDKCHFGADAVDADRVQRFLAHRKRSARCTFGDTAALRQMADLPLLKHVTEPSTRSFALSERERVKEGFCKHLLQDRGLTPSTPACYLRHISSLLRERFRGRFCTVRSTDLHGYHRVHSASRRRM